MDIKNIDSFFRKKRAQLELKERWNKMARPRGTDSAKVIQVIKTESMRGEGTLDDLCRIVTQYWDFEGNLLAENDPCITESVTQGDV